MKPDNTKLIERCTSILALERDPSFQRHVGGLLRARQSEFLGLVKDGSAPMARVRFAQGVLAIIDEVERLFRNAERQLDLARKQATEG